MIRGIRRRAQMVQKILAEEMPRPEVPLHHRDAFTLLVAVMLSARCTDARVNTVTPALFALAPTPEAMAALSWQQVQPLIATCGLTEMKARRLVETARLIVERHHGQVPDSFEALEALPGVGHKTASVVMNQAFGYPAFPVDTHIFRLAHRWKLSGGKSVEQVEKELKSLFPQSVWGHLHLQMVLWGRFHCPARGCKPSCRVCSALDVVS